ncbi:MAG TPA: PfkB family carbohydrate kinase [Mycobacterium sp.]|nr:PfkB family carbohydrate kinase [Mycobacterium sp.]
MVVSREGSQRIPAFAVDVVDTTGCGDAFSAGFVYAISIGRAPRDAAVLGNAVAALVAAGWAAITVISTWRAPTPSPRARRLCSACAPGSSGDSPRSVRPASDKRWTAARARGEVHAQKRLPRRTLATRWPDETLEDAAMSPLSQMWSGDRGSRLSE